MLPFCGCNRNEIVGMYEKGKKADLFPTPASLFRDTLLLHKRMLESMEYQVFILSYDKYNST